jgi:hypothetical protein
MLRRIILGIIVLGAVGLVAGYLIFARTSHGYLSLKSLLEPSKNIIDRLVKNVGEIPQKRQSILICGAVGGGIGLVVGAVTGGGRRR